MLSLVILFFLVLWVIQSPAAEPLTTCEPRAQALLLAIAECDNFQSPLDCLPLNAFLNRPLINPQLALLNDLANSESNSVFAQRLRQAADFEKRMRQGFAELNREASPNRWLVIRDELEQQMENAPAGLKPTLQAYAHRFDDYAEFMVSRGGANPLPSTQRATLAEYIKLRHEMKKRQRHSALKALESLAALNSPLQVSFQSALLATRQSLRPRPDLAILTIRNDVENIILEEKGLKAKRPYVWLNSFADRNENPLIAPLQNQAGENKRTVANVAMAVAGSIASQEATKSCLQKLLQKEKIKLGLSEQERLVRHLSMAGPAHRCDLNIDREQLAALLRYSPSRPMCDTLQVLSESKLANLTKFTPHVAQLRCQHTGLSAQVRIGGEKFDVEFKLGQDRLTLIAPFEQNESGSSKFSCALTSPKGRWQWCDKIESSIIDAKNPYLQIISSVLLTPRYAWQSVDSCPKIAPDGPGSREHVRRQLCSAGKIFQAINFTLSPALGPCFGERMSLNST